MQPRNLVSLSGILLSTSSSQAWLVAVLSKVAMSAKSPTALNACGLSAYLTAPLCTSLLQSSVIWRLQTFVSEEFNSDYGPSTQTLFGLFYLLGNVTYWNMHNNSEFSWPFWAIAGRTTPIRSWPHCQTSCLGAETICFSWRREKHKDTQMPDWERKSFIILLCLKIEGNP